MPDSGPETPAPPDPEDVERIEEIADLQGDAMPIDQDAFLEPDEFEKHREPTQTELDRGESVPDREGDLGLASTFDLLAAEELREGETDDPDVATEEGLTYVPPSDPPTRADEEEAGGVEIAAGAGVSAFSDPYDDDHESELLSDEPDLTARIRDALESDAATTELADRLIIGTRGSTVVVRGVVDDIDDGDNIASVIERVAGVDEVIDQTELAGG
jgi:hypothetical protein